MQNAPLKFNPEDWFAFFGEHGWHCKEIRYLAEEADRLQRPMQLPPLSKVITSLRMAFASNEQRTAFKKLAGFVMLEPGSTAGDKAPAAEPVPKPHGGDGIKKPTS